MAESVIQSSDIVGTVYDPPRPPVCGPCDVRDKRQKRALWYCRDCEEYFCDDCKAWHGTIKGNRSHKLDRVVSNQSSTRLADSVRFASDFVEDVGRISLDVICGPCDARGKPNQTAPWQCVDCDDFLCDECKTVHGTIKATRTHKIYPVSEHGFCKKHKHKPIIYFCVSDGEYCCQECVHAEHRKCEETVPLAKQKQAKLVKEFDATIPGDKENVSLTGAAFLPDSMLLFVDEPNNRLKVFGPDYKFLYGKTLRCKPFDIAVYDSSEIALSCGCDNKVVRLSVEKPITEKGEISTGCNASGIAYISKDKLIITDKVSNTLTVFSIDGQKLSTIKNDEIGSVLKKPYYCCYDTTKSVLYITNFDGNNVCAIDLSSKTVVFNCKHISLKGPYGLCLAKNSNILLTLRNSDEICEISPDGLFIGIVVAKEDMLGHPNVIAVSGDGGRFVVSFKKNRVVRVYSFV